MTVKRKTFTVAMEDGQEHTVEVLHGDQLRAELEAGRYSIPTDPSQLPLATTTLWVWAAMTRMKLTTAKFPAFRGQVVGMERTELPLEDTVGPTQQDQPTEGP